MGLCLKHIKHFCEFSFANKCEGPQIPTFICISICAFIIFSIVCIQVTGRIIACTTTLTLPHDKNSSFVLEALASFFCLAKIKLWNLMFVLTNPSHSFSWLYCATSSGVTRFVFSALHIVKPFHMSNSWHVYSLNKLLCDQNSCFSTTSHGVTRFLCLLRSHFPLVGMYLNLFPPLVNVPFPGENHIHYLYQQKWCNNCVTLNPRYQIA